MSLFCLQKQARAACKTATTCGDAVRLVAKVMFTKEELLECSVRGHHTNKGVEKRPGLDASRLKFLISKYQISSQVQYRYEAKCRFSTDLKKLPLRIHNSGVWTFWDNSKSCPPPPQKKKKYIYIYLTAFDKTGLPAKTKFNSFRVALLYPSHPLSFSQPTTIVPPAGSPRPGLPHSTILVATEPRKAERLIFKRCTPKLPLEF